MRKGTKKFALITPASKYDVLTVPTNRVQYGTRKNTQHVILDHIVEVKGIQGDGPQILLGGLAPQIHLPW